MAGLFTNDEEAILRKHIAKAEKSTSGEIRVFIERKCKGSPEERALEVFFNHKMDRTESRNAVIIYIAYESRQIFVWGDEGIHQKAGFELWDHVVHQMIADFSGEKYLEGICKGIDKIGEKLKAFFPVKGNFNKNELSDDIIQN